MEWYLIAANLITVGLIYYKSYKERYERTEAIITVNNNNERLKKVTKEVQEFVKSHNENLKAYRQSFLENVTKSEAQMVETLQMEWLKMKSEMEIKVANLEGQIQTLKEAPVLRQYIDRYVPIKNDAEVTEETEKAMAKNSQAFNEMFGFGGNNVSPEDTV